MRALDGAARTTTASRGPPTRRDWPSCATKRRQSREGKPSIAWADGSAAQRKPSGGIGEDAAFPQGFVLSEYTAPRWTRDGARRQKAQEDSRSEKDEPQANLDI
jgi:hypothetical protein